MGIFKAGMGAIGGTFADQWLEVIEPAKMDSTTLVSYGVSVRRDSRSSNKRGTEDTVSNGSIIHVPVNTYMLLVDGGKIIAATDEEGYFQVDNSRAPSIFFKAADGIGAAGYGNTGQNSIQRPGGFVNTIKDSWERFKFGGTTPVKQRVVFINKQEITDIRFGTKSPVPYTDRVMVPGRGVPCKVTSFGTYSIKIGDPLLFYSEVCSKTSKANLSSTDLAEQYINEFLMAYTTALSNLSMQYVMVSDIATRTMELGQYMAEVLDKEWLLKRGFYIHSVGIAGMNYDEKTSELLDKYGNDLLLSDPNSRAARMTGSLAAGLEAAGSNQGGAMIGFAGMNMGMNAAAMMGAMPGQQMPYPQGNTAAPVTGGWACTCGNNLASDAIFCSKCGSKKPTNENKSQDHGWKCSCGRNVTEGMFCPSCGSKKPEDKKWACSCGNINEDMFCFKCGQKRPDPAAAQPTYKCNKCGWQPEDPKNPPAFCPRCGDPFNDADKQV